MQNEFNGGIRENGLCKNAKQIAPGGDRTQVTTKSNDPMTYPADSVLYYIETTCKAVVANHLRWTWVNARPLPSQKF